MFLVGFATWDKGQANRLLCFIYLKLNLLRKCPWEIQCSGEVKRCILQRITRVMSYNYKGCYGNKSSWIEKVGGGRNIRRRWWRHHMTSVWMEVSNGAVQGTRKAFSKRPGSLNLEKRWELLGRGSGSKQIPTGFLKGPILIISTRARLCICCVPSYILSSAPRMD